MPLAISIYSDVVCPWCFIGKRRLERALDALGLRSKTAIEWLPFELNPDMPEGGMPRAEYRARKFGADKAAALDDAMTARGRDEGIAFAFDRIARTPNTRATHRLLLHAGRQGRGDATKEALLRAYFEDARDVGDRSVLADVAAGLGLAEAVDALDDPALARDVLAFERQAAAIGVTGVPFFIVDGRWAVSGAQPTETWIASLRERAAVPEGAAAG